MSPENGVMPLGDRPVTTIWKPSASRRTSSSRIVGLLAEVLLRGLPKYFTAIQRKHNVCLIGTHWHRLHDALAGVDSVARQDTKGLPAFDSVDRKIRPIRGQHGRALEGSSSACTAIVVRRLQRARCWRVGSQRLRSRRRNPVGTCGRSRHFLARLAGPRNV